MAGPFDFLHIKGRTVGSSNELSFDVLDAARSDADAQERATKKKVGFKPSQGSYHGVAGTATFSAAPEVARRKHVRRARAIRIWVVVVVAIVALIGVGAFFGYEHYRTTSDFKGQFNALIERFKDADETIAEIDTFMGDPVAVISEQGLTRNDRTGEEELAIPLSIEELTDRAMGIKRELNAMSVEAQRLKELSKRDEDKAVLAQVVYASESREKMLENAEKAFSVAREAEAKVIKTNATWSKVLEADKLARSAAEQANEAKTEETTLEARRNTEQARRKFEDARGELLSLESKNPRVSFTEEVKYIEKRVESLDAAVKTANYLLANNREAATAANNAYNAADKEAAELAMKLPDSEGKKVAQVYEPQLQRSRQDYSDNRALAATADSAIRAYLQGR